MSLALSWVFGNNTSSMAWLLTCLLNTWSFSFTTDNTSWGHSSWYWDNIVPHSEKGCREVSWIMQETNLEGELEWFSKKEDSWTRLVAMRPRGHLDWLVCSHMQESFGLCCHLPWGEKLGFFCYTEWLRASSFLIWASSFLLYKWKFLSHPPVPE